MDIFSLRKKLVGDYEEYIRGFVNIRDARLKEKAEDAFSSGVLWPDPLIQLNPSFLPGANIDALVSEKVLHAECGKVFRAKKDTHPGGLPMTLHTHQVEAIRAAARGCNYVLSTGTGSGKSLSYIVPIVDHIVRRGSGKGVQAIIVYPMNALANSQYGELTKFVRDGYAESDWPVSFARYTGQETEAEKEIVRTCPPDIILTNYVMLELMLTRPEESQSIIKSAKGLRFLVLDELHTYRGRQGADVALLIRRLKDRIGSGELICVGTSATLSSAGTYKEQQKDIADVASRLFGATVFPENVIGETIRRETPDVDFNKSENILLLKERITGTHPVPTEYVDFISDPLASWIESTFGVVSDKTGRLIRQTPISIRGANGANIALANITGLSPELCADKIEEALLGGYHCKPNPLTGNRPFAFRLHQFLSRGDTIYASLEDEVSRYLTIHKQQFVPEQKGHFLYPMVFCRECGQEFYCTRKIETEDGRVVYEPRSFDEGPQDPTEKPNFGYLFFCPDRPWPDDEADAVERLPEDWVEDFQGGRRVKSNRRSYLPELLALRPDGTQSADGMNVHYVSVPFRFCPHCGVAYDSGQQTDYPKLAMLGSDGRSTATTILCISTILALQTDMTIEKVARKLLSFTDNRQDASLQAGHFNDFLETSLVRAAVCKATTIAGEQGVMYDELPQKVFDALNLPAELYLADPTVKYAQLHNANAAFRNVLSYRIYRDLKRGWRILSPNLEQLGLLRIEYISLNELCNNNGDWLSAQDGAQIHHALALATPATRKEVAGVLLDYLRRNLAINAEPLSHAFHERIKLQSSQFLIEPWAIDESERLEYATIAFPYARGQEETRQNIFISSKGRFGRFLRSANRFPHLSDPLTMEDTQKVIQDLFRVLGKAGLVRSACEPIGKQELPGYQVPASCLRWIASDGKTPYVDPIRTVVASDVGAKPSAFFQNFYQKVALTTKGLLAHEHTAQVPSEVREEREKAFKEAELPVLFCSPTMELGVDISQLNVVNMRNVPPTPANYAQRSGRAGRSGQPALVFTYCAVGSPHDQYFFRRPHEMVKGAVLPPRIDLGNEDLVKSHVQAIWLAETGVSLGSSLKEILEVDGETPSLELQQRIIDAFNNKAIKDRAANRALKVLATIQNDLDETDWFGETWLSEQVINPIERAFGNACERWRSLFLAALNQMREQSKVIESAVRSADDKKRARNLRREAEAQHELLIQSSKSVQADFYSYRYFASEGFLPGYSFPRLPLSAYIPGKQGNRNRDDFLSRPRFLAVSEFGPRARIYHEGAQYEVNKVILPAREGEEVDTRKAKLCPTCGYLHEINANKNADVCDLCKTELAQPLTDLFRLQNVSARKRERISSDEEERLRQGYDVKSAVRFADRGDGPSYQIAEVKDPSGGVRFRLLYGQAADIWRINCGWRRRKDYSKMGFVLDLERGFWESSLEVPANEDGSDEKMSESRRVVIPFVEDRKNCLIIEPTTPLEPEEMASLQAALKFAIQINYQLEENELATEALPDSKNRNRILIYESSEGGAGVLRQIVKSETALAEIARVALRLCHFDPESGEDLGHAPGIDERCEAACYHCLLSYGNQPDHKYLDRQKVLPWLILMRDATIEVSPTTVSRSRHLENLLALAESSLERKWLNFLQEHGCGLPDKAQARIESCNTRPDFLYDNECSAAIYVDGPPHDYPDRQQRDAEQEECLLNASYIVIRFHHEDDWTQVIRRYPSIFGGAL